MGRPKGSKNKPRPGFTAEEKGRTVHEDLENGTATFTDTVATAPRTAEEIIELLQIDQSKYRLMSYWNKEKGKGANRRWEISALVGRKKDEQVDKQDMAQILKEVFQDVNLSPVAFEPQPSNHKALFLYLSDKHIAAYVDRSRAVYPNEYNAGVYQQRMLAVLKEAWELKAAYGTFEDVYILDMGDRMDGAKGKTTRGGHTLPQNQTDREAYRTAIRVEKEFLDRLFASGVGNHYHVLQNANSNHGGDFDFMIAEALVIYLNAVYPEVRTRTLEKFIEHEFYGVHALLLTHGKDDEDQKFGLPFHLNDKAENYLTKYMMEYGIDPKTHRVSLIKGDLHRDASEIASHLRYRNAMSLFGGSKWIGTNFGPTRPGCSYDIYEKHSHRILEGRILF
jgi:hypothetical protein